LYYYVLEELRSFYSSLFSFALMQKKPTYQFTCRWHGRQAKNQG
jgi:hypothetical protein